jgi:hypothetical protein
MRGRRDAGMGRTMMHRRVSVADEDDRDIVRVGGGVDTRCARGGRVDERVRV